MEANAGAANLPSPMDEAAFRAAIEESIATKQGLLVECLPQIQELSRLAVGALSRGGKLMFCGNGGSACDAAHAAGELVGWFENKNRVGYAALALGHDVPTLTAVANDAGFDAVFARQVVALGRAEDMLIGISTSGASPNVVSAMQAAREIGMAVGALVSTRAGPMSDLADVAVRVPSANTARIQESHLLCVHLLCAEVESQLKAN